MSQVGPKRGSKEFKRIALRTTCRSSWCPWVAFKAMMETWKALDGTCCKKVKMVPPHFVHLDLCFPMFFDV